VTFNAISAAVTSTGHGSGDVGPMLPDDVGATGMPHRARAIPPGSFDIRYYDRVEDDSVVRRLWFRALDPMPADVITHQCVVALISDLYFFEPIFAQHGLQGNDRRIRYATTQHCLWFHRPPVADDWHVIESRSPAAANGRGLVTGQIRALDGALVATAVQEVAVRFPDSVETESTSRSGTQGVGRQTSAT
jgi:acyl-CoA thioesterase-2